MEPRLYLIMRNDVPSMNPGKLAAQAAHVANQFVFDYHKRFKEPQQHNLIDMYNAWIENRGFGTTITLGAPREWFNRDAYYIPNTLYGEVFDPTYPCSVPKEVAEYWLRQPIGSYNLAIGQFIVTELGNGVFLRPELVGAYMFIDKDTISPMNPINDLELYP